MFFRPLSLKIDLNKIGGGNVTICVSFVYIQCADSKQIDPVPMLAPSDYYNFVAEKTLINVLLKIIVT